MPFAAFMGIRFDRRGDELTAVLPWRDALTGNPMLPAMHGGATSAFLEMTAMIELAWSMIWAPVERGEIDAADTVAAAAREAGARAEEERALRRSAEKGRAETKR